MLVADPLNLRNGGALFTKGFVSPSGTGLNTTLSTFITLENQVKNNNLHYNCLKLKHFYSLGSHDRVQKAAVAAMKGANNFEDILKSDNDATLGRGNRIKKKKNFDLPESMENARKKKKTVRSRSEQTSELQNDSETNVVQVNLDSHVEENQVERSQYVIIPDDGQQVNLKDVIFPLFQENWDENNSNVGDRSPIGI